MRGECDYGKWRGLRGEIIYSHDFADNWSPECPDMEEQLEKLRGVRKDGEKTYWR